MACASFTLFFAASHLLLLFIIQECKSCPFTVYYDCKEAYDNDHVYDYKGGFECDDLERTCTNGGTMINCTGPNQVLSIFSSNHTIVLKHHRVDHLVFVCANFSTPSPVVNFSFPRDPNTFTRCPDGPDDTFIHGPCEKAGHCPDKQPGCIPCQKLLSEKNFSVPYSVTDQGDQICVDPSHDDGRHGKEKLLRIVIVSVLSGLAVVFILVAVFWIRRRSKSGLTTSSSRIISLNRALSVPERASMNGVAVFSYTELQEATNNFDAAKELGEGGFGIVYHGKLRDGREVAVKRMYEKNYKQVEQFNNEIRILTSLQHPNLVTLYGSTSRHSRELLLVYEYIPNKTLADHLHGDQAMSALLSWPKRMSIAIETATALSYLHFKEVIHRDIKTDNILLDSNFHAKVADFGLSRLFPADLSHVSTAPQGTPGYLDPEYHQCYHLSDKSDVYSFGVVLVELIWSLPAIDLGRHRHEVNLSVYAMNRIQCCAFGELVDGKLGFETDFKVRRMTTLVAELAFRCLQGGRELRPSMEEVLEELKSLESADYGELEAEEIGDEK